MRVVRSQVRVDEQRIFEHDREPGGIVPHESESQRSGAAGEQLVAVGFGHGSREHDGLVHDEIARTGVQDRQREEVEEVVIGDAAVRTVPNAAQSEDAREEDEIVARRLHAEDESVKKIEKLVHTTLGQFLLEAGVEWIRLRKRAVQLQSRKRLVGSDEHSESSQNLVNADFPVAAAAAAALRQTPPVIRHGKIKSFSIRSGDPTAKNTIFNEETLCVADDFQFRFNAALAQFIGFWLECAPRFVAGLEFGKLAHRSSVVRTVEFLVVELVQIGQPVNELDQILATPQQEVVAFDPTIGAPNG